MTDPLIAHLAAGRPARGEDTCVCCKGKGDHNGTPCQVCDDGIAPYGQLNYCPGFEPRRETHRRRHWRQGAADPQAEMVRTDKLMRHREWHHGPGWSKSPEGEQMAPRHSPGEWADLAADVKASGIREPIHMHWDPKSNYAYIAEGNSRLAWAHAAGQEYVPVIGHRHSWIPDRRAYKLPGPSRAAELKERSGGHIGADLKPSDFLPDDYMHPGFRHQAAGDYRMQHQGPDEDSGEALHEIGTGGIYPSDVHQHPDWYGAEHEETMTKLYRNAGRPYSRVSIYRSLPSPHRSINTGDWVATAAAYARDHGRETDPKDDWPVVKATVRADQIRNDGNSLEEWSYHGPPIHRAVLHFGGGENHRGKSGRGRTDSETGQHEPEEMGRHYSEMLSRAREQKKAHKEAEDAWQRGEGPHPGQFRFQAGARDLSEERAAWEATAPAPLVREEEPQAGLIHHPPRTAAIRMVPPEEYSQYEFGDYGEHRLHELPAYFRARAPYFDKLKEDIRQHGIREPMLVRHTHDGKPDGLRLPHPRVMSGHHRGAAALELGLHMPVGDYDDPGDFQAGNSEHGRQWWREHHEDKEREEYPWRQHEGAQRYELKPDEFYHGTRHKFRPGQVLDPAQHEESHHQTAGHFYMTWHRAGADDYATDSLQHAADKPHTYVVRPRGKVEGDPHDTSGLSFRTQHPVEVVRELKHGAGLYGHYGRYVTVDEARARGRQGPWYHGSQHSFEPGAYVNPRKDPGKPLSDGTWTYLTSSTRSAYGLGGPRVHEVVPLGPIEHDPHETEMSGGVLYRTRVPMRVVRQLDDSEVDRPLPGVHEGSTLTGNEAGGEINTVNADEPSFAAGPALTHQSALALDPLIAAFTVYAGPPAEDWEENLRKLRYRKRNEPLMHRGLALVLPPEVHDFVHDQFQSRDRQARAILDHLSSSGQGLGMHWSSEEQTPRHFADLERRHSLPGSTKVILHAALPEVQHIETDPQRLRDEAVYRNDSWMTPEHEIPVKAGAPVSIKGVTWYGPGNRKRTGWPYGQEHTAAQDPDAECPSCGRGARDSEPLRFTIRGRSYPSHLVSCKGCDEVYDASKSGAQSRVDREVAEMAYRHHKEQQKHEHDLAEKVTGKDTRPQFGWHEAPEELSRKSNEDRYTVFGIPASQTRGTGKESYEHRMKKLPAMPAYDPGQIPPHMSALQPRDELPPDPGTQPIPEGHVRLWHYTPLGNADSIREHGLLRSKARGDSGTGDLSEPSAGVWASTRRPDEILDNHSAGAAVVEFHAHPGEISGNAESPWQAQRKDRSYDPQQLKDWAGGYHHVIMHGDVKPHQILSVHEPWHGAARYMRDDDPSLKSYQWIKDEDDSRQNEHLQPYKRGLHALERPDFGHHEASASLENMRGRGYNTEGWSEWQQGRCGTYACALMRMNPRLRFGTAGTEDFPDSHFFAHDDTHAYDSAGRHPLPYHGVHGDLTQSDLDQDAEYFGLPDDEAGPEGGEHHIRRAMQHAREHGILEGRFGHHEAVLGMSAERSGQRLGRLDPLIAAFMSMEELGGCHAVHEASASQYVFTHDVHYPYGPGNVPEKWEHEITARTPEGELAGKLRWKMKNGRTTAIVVAPSHQRRGLATAMWEEGAKYDPPPRHSYERTDEGDKWARAMKGTRPRTQRTLPERAPVLRECPSGTHEQLHHPGALHEAMATEAAFYHGDTRAFGEGDEITPESSQNEYWPDELGEPEGAKVKRVFFSEDPQTAHAYGMGWKEPGGGVYRVEPTGPYHPHRWESGTLVSAHPLRVVEQTERHASLDPLIAALGIDDSGHIVEDRDDGNGFQHLDGSCSEPDGSVVTDHPVYDAWHRHVIRASREEKGDRWHEYRSRYLPDTLHRGVHAQLDPDVHDYVHDESVPREDRARVLLDNAHRLGLTGLGQHWTPHISVAHRAIGNAADEFPGAGGTDVIFHAHAPGRRNEIRDPAERERQGVGWQYSRDEDETFLREGAPLRLQGISWKLHEPGYPNEAYEHHDFPKAIRHTAEREWDSPEHQEMLAHMTSVHHYPGAEWRSPGQLEEQHERDHLASPELQTESGIELHGHDDDWEAAHSGWEHGHDVSHQEAGEWHPGLIASRHDEPWMPQPSDEQLSEHLRLRHGMDPETQLHGDARHWGRWHQSEHRYSTAQNHQHAHLSGAPAEDLFPAAHDIPEDASDVMGISGGHRTYPHKRGQPIQTSPYLPPDPNAHLSSLDPLVAHFVTAVPHPREEDLTEGDLDWLRKQGVRYVAPYKGRKDWPLYRGIDLELPPELHRQVHDESLPVTQRARLLAAHVAPLHHGMHWTHNHETAGVFSTAAEPEQTRVVLRAEHPGYGAIERSDAELDRRGVNRHKTVQDREEDYEAEVPLKARTPLKLTGIGWAPGGPGAAMLSDIGMRHWVGFRKPEHGGDYEMGTRDLYPDQDLKLADRGPADHIQTQASRPHHFASRREAGHAFPNIYHGDPEFGGNPEFSHTWFHGTRGEPEFGERRGHGGLERAKLPPEERMKGSGWPQPNQMMGIHLSPLHEVGHKFASSLSDSGSAIVHARLNFHNPAHFPTERHLNYAVAHWASQHYPHWHDEKVNGQMGWNYSDREGTRRDFSHVPEGYGDRAQDILQWHPHLPEIIRGFHQHLRDTGHHGITYGNMVEGPYSADATRGGEAGTKYITKTKNWPGDSPRHISAIAQPEDIQATHVEHISGWKKEPEPHEHTWEQASEHDEPDEMRDKVLAFHREHGGAYPASHQHTAAWQPSSGIFAPTTGLDPLLFESDGHLRSEARQEILDKVADALQHEGYVTTGLVPPWLRAYLAGGSASEWAGGRPNENARDLDVLIGLDYRRLREQLPVLPAGLPGAGAGVGPDFSDADLERHLNNALRQHFNDESWRPAFGGHWSLTGYVNPHAWDISVLRPYAAYDLTNDRWAVRPPHSPGHAPDLGYDPGPQARAIASEIRAIMHLPEPHRSHEARSIWDRIHADRSRAFSAEGQGYTDPGNTIEKFLAYHPWKPLDKLRQVIFDKAA